MIHMQSVYNEENNAMNYEHPSLQYVIGNSLTVANMENLNTLEPFSDLVVDFFNDLSKKLLRVGRGYSDVATFGFWCRRSALLSERSKYDDVSSRLGKGVVFHSTPSNVPVNFAFSFAAGLLAGNANIVRIPGKDFEQVSIISNAIRELLETNYADIAPYIVFVKYPPIQNVTGAFCRISNTRVVWGGDGTIAEMRQSALPPRANEITFADRHSIAVIDADGYLSLGNKDKIAEDFYNDTYFSDQNACTAPRVIVWLGKEKEKAKTEFWKRAHDLVQEKYAITPVQTIGKLHMLYKVACHRNIYLVKDINTEIDQLVTRVKTENLVDLMRYKYNSGFFFEYDAECIDEILPLCDERCQTLTYCGIDKETVNHYIRTIRPRGVDRVVPMGKSMDFGLIWDGHDLIREMSRRVIIL